MRGGEHVRDADMFALLGMSAELGNVGMSALLGMAAVLSMSAMLHVCCVLHVRVAGHVGRKSEPNRRTGSMYLFLWPSIFHLRRTLSHGQVKYSFCCPSFFTQLAIIFIK